MSQRWPGWSHLRLAGEDKQAAAAHLPEARQLLGQAMASGLGVVKLQQELDDGTVVTAEKHGDIPRMTITPPPVPPGPEAPVPGSDFVVWARDASQTAGIDADHPQQILQHQDDSWRTYFYSASIPAHDAFAGARGTYIGTFPDGITHAGNVDWRGRAGMRVSWYGPSTRYWVDPYVQVRQQYGRQVFMLGQVLLDVPTYDTDSVDTITARYVMGAAIDGTHLYVMQAELPEGATTTASQAAGTTLVDPYYPVGAIAHRLCRYTLVPDTEHLGFMRVVAGSRAVLWSDTLRTGGMPWFFDRDAAQARCYGIPAGTVGGIDLAVRALSGSNTAPSAAAPYWMLARDGDAITVSEGSESVGPAGTGVLAADFDAAGALVEIRVRREQLTRSAEDGGNQRRDHWHLVLGTVDVDLATMVQHTSSMDWDQRYVVFADARVGVLILAREHYVLPGATSREVWIEVWHKGKGFFTEQVPAGTDTSTATGLPRVIAVDDFGSEVTGGVAVSPMWALYGFTLAVGTIETQRGYQQSHAGALVLPYQAASYFGAYKLGGTAGAPTPAAARCSVTAARARPDVDGKDVTFAAAADKDALMFSGYPFAQDSLDSTHHVTDTTLQALTGVAGANARFHPLWMLGKPHPATRTA